MSVGAQLEQCQLVSSHISCCSPSNPEGFSTLWVGNVETEVTSKTINDMFSK